MMPLNYLGQEVTQAVITPLILMIHKDKQRWMLENCRSFEVLRIINEPNSCFISLRFR
jgi:hypothetical protein